MFDAVIVGAGLAGLSAARELTRQGLTVRVLEARDRVAGRNEGGTFSNGVPVELGGQWVGPTQDAVLGLIDEFGLEIFPTYSSEQSMLVVGGQTHYGDEDSFGLPPESLDEFRRVLEAVETLTASIDTTAPWRSPEAQTLDRVTVDAWLRAQTEDDLVRRFYETMFASLFTAETEEFSLLHFLFYLASAGGLHRLMATEDGAQEWRVVGGTHQISERMAAELGDRVVLNSPVTSIRQNGQSVDVEYRGGMTTAKRVVVAIPPVLAGRLNYSPPMPANRDSLTQQMPAGTVIKYQIGYETPFWREQGLSADILSLDTTVGLVYDNCQPDGKTGVLVAFVEGNHARALNRLSVDERRTAVLKDIVDFFGPGAANPTDFLERNWNEEEYTRGCYGGRLGTGVWTHLGHALAEPVGLIHWAGAETAATWSGYMDGAISSGRRAALEILESNPGE